MPSLERINPCRILATDPNNRGVRELAITASKRQGGCLIGDLSEEILSRGQKGICITTGFYIADAGMPETDGPGAAYVMASFLSSLSCKVYILVDDSLSSIFRSLFHLVRCVNVITLSEIKDDRLNKICSVIVSIEKAGRNKFGVYHNMMGLDISKYTSPIDIYMEKAMEKGILTIGIGDGGNEIGMGLVHDIVRKRVKYGAVCNCPCKGGIASISRTNALLVSGVSNWAGYLLTLGIMYLSGRLRRDLTPFKKKVLEGYRKMYTLGFVDGITGKPSISEDGVSLYYSFKLVEDAFFALKANF